MGKFLAVLGIVGIVGLVYLLSPNKKTVNWKSVGLAFIMQIVLAGALILTPLWKVGFNGLGVPFRNITKVC